MKIQRRFTKPGTDVFNSVTYEKRTSRISNPDGSVVFEMNDAEIPAQWSQLATDIMVSKYFRKAGVPQTDPATGQPLKGADGHGVTGPAQGHYYCDPRTGELTRGADAYTHPQPHACFIQSVRDDLVGDGGIMDLWTREARLFKYGSGTGTNFSKLPGEKEKLSGGGRSSGLMSFLKI